MIKPNGVHHLAITTAKMKEQIAFFNEVLGMELCALYWMHGVEGYWHGFMKANDSCYIAFVCAPAIKEIPVEFGKTHAGNPVSPCSPGVMQHLAFNVDTEEQMYVMRDRIRAKGIQVFGPVDHGLCKSMYFAGPENLALEIATSKAAIDGKAWIDPEVAALAGITPEEVERYRSHQPFADRKGAVPQPPYNPARPHLSPDAMAEAWGKMTDAEFFAMISNTQPPVKVAA
jgi:catechol 2,3-dioxygenase-like lactoylglutathione lyase family enzyme